MNKTVDKRELAESTWMAPSPLSHDLCSSSTATSESPKNFPGAMSNTAELVKVASKSYVEAHRARISKNLSMSFTDTEYADQLLRMLRIDRKETSQSVGLEVLNIISHPVVEASASALC